MLLRKGKKRLILEQICFPYLSDMFPTQASCKLALTHPDAYNVEHLVELALAQTGGYEFVDADGYDFLDEDFSDSKTCTLRQKDQMLTIGKTENKIGSFRIVVYNEIKDDLDYIYLTSRGRVCWTESHFADKKPWEERIRTCWTETRDSYNKLEMYRVNNFKELALMTDNKFETYSRHCEDSTSFVEAIFEEH